jgi:hypothetical protein
MRNVFTDMCHLVIHIPAVVYRPYWIHRSSVPGMFINKHFNLFRGRRIIRYGPSISSILDFPAPSDTLAHYNSTRQFGDHIFRRNES